MNIVEKIRRAGQRKGKREGLQLGMQQGIQQGIQQGVQAGRREEALRIARAMLESGVEREFIAQITGLSEAEMDSLLH